MNYVGQPVKRFEDPKLIAGRGAFVDDIKLPDMLHAAVLRSPHARAHVKRLDALVDAQRPWAIEALEIAGEADSEAARHVSCQPAMEFVVSHEPPPSPA